LGGRVHRKVLAKINSCAVIGLMGEIVEVEVDISNGMPRFNIVGLPDTAVNEAKERVRSAIKNSGQRFPGTQHITVNLAPADLRTEGPAYDLPIAIGILMASAQVPEARRDTVFIGELSLDGRLRHTNGILAMVGLARERGYTTVFVPAVDAGEAALVTYEVIPVESLVALAEHLRPG
jgi:magnesium chelatase family protein